MPKSKKYGSYSDKKKRNNALKIGAIVLGTTFCVSGIYQFVILDFYGKRVRENTIKELTSENGGYVQTYLIKNEISQGSEVNESMLEPITVNAKYAPANSIKDISNIDEMSARIKLLPNTIITEDMIINMEERITDTIKNSDFNWIRIHTFLEVGNYVDIHYKEVDGTDTIVASKKKVTNLSGNTFSANISELERAYINNATVRAAITGGELYLSIYPEPENQNAAEVTYVLDKTIQSQIEKDPNIVNKSAEKLIKNSDSSINDKPNFIGEDK
ncbi:hypothetical protein [Clostridium butyricum]|uniref:hypothetical protein n=1 Tax=Clostridium butyricum TaxID=1492 RepID=UPI002AB1985A|nr:hypothetical protein [Clostridium butyricum]